MPKECKFTWHFFPHINCQNGVYLNIHQENVGTIKVLQYTMFYVYGWGGENN